MGLAGGDSGEIRHTEVSIERNSARTEHRNRFRRKTDPETGLPLLDS